MRKYLRIAAIVFAAVLVLVEGIHLLPGGWKGLFSAVYFAIGGKPGAELRFQVQVQDAVKDQADAVVGRLDEELQKARFEGVLIDLNQPSSSGQADSIEIRLKGVPAARAGELRGLIGARFQGWVLAPVNETECRLTPGHEKLTVWKRQAFEQTLTAVGKRIRGMGLVARAVRGPGDVEITVQLASSGGDTTRLSRILCARSRLELAAVVEGPFQNGDEPLVKHGGRIPQNARLIRQPAGEGDQPEFWFVVSRTPVVSGRDLRNARPVEDETHRWATAFSLTKDAAARFGRFTESNVGNRLAIVLDNRVLSAPTITERIEDSGIISGVRDEQEASDLALVLRSGELPAGLAPREGQ